MNKKEFLSGLLFLIIGGFFKIQSQSYEFGTASFMGPGYYPNLLSNILIIIALLIIAKSFLWKS